MDIDTMITTYNTADYYTPWKGDPTAMPERHSSKVLWKVILNRLKIQAKKIIHEEQAGFRLEGEP
ncbi:MAG: hypothetical protein AB2693_21405 [Candidatus Thiodiazotropha sp.]